MICHREPWERSSTIELDLNSPIEVLSVLPAITTAKLKSITITATELRQSSPFLLAQAGHCPQPIGHRICSQLLKTPQYLNIQEFGSAWSPPHSEPMNNPVWHFVPYSYVWHPMGDWAPKGELVWSRTLTLGSWIGFWSWMVVMAATAKRACFTPLTSTLQSS